LSIFKYTLKTLDKQMHFLYLFDIGFPFLHLLVQYLKPRDVIHLRLTCKFLYFRIQGPYRPSEFRTASPFKMISTVYEIDTTVIQVSRHSAGNPYIYLKCSEHLRDPVPLFPSFLGCFTSTHVYPFRLASSIRSVSGFIGWRDQGYGYQKSKVFLMISRTPVFRYDHWEVIQNLKLCGPAPHGFARERFKHSTFPQTHAGAYLNLFVEIGHGGGHTIKIFEFYLKIKYNLA